MEATKTQTYPEINSMSLQDLRHALVMGVNAYDAIKPEYQADLRSRLDAIRDRIRRLTATGRRIAAIQVVRA